MIRKMLVVAAVAVAIPFGLVACGGDDEDTETAASETTEQTTEDSGGGAESVAISETEFALDPAAESVAAGPVTIEVANDGQTLHNLEVEGNGVEEITADLEPGDSDSLELDLESGTYELYCAIGDHREQGMEGELTVE